MYNYYSKQAGTCQSFGCVLKLFKVLQFHSVTGEKLHMNNVTRRAHFYTYMATLV